MNILIVDDRESNLYSLSSFIESKFKDKDIEVYKSSSGEDALKRVLIERVDLVILDIQMPNMNGFEVAKLLKMSSKTKDIPIIFLTAVFKKEEFVKYGYEIGAVDYLIKPVDDNQFFNKIKLYYSIFQRERELAKVTEELKSYREFLEERVRDEVNKNRKKDKFLIQQSKLISLGEMLGAIAHQWRQPLNSINLSLYLLDEEIGSLSIEDREVLKNIREYLDVALKTTEYLSHTIDDFRNFFKPSKKRERFNISKAIEDTLSLISAQFKNYSIEIEFNPIDITMFGYLGEFKQVILNILNNAKDAVISKLSKDSSYSPKVKIELTKEGSLVIIKISDNTDGIDSDILDKIFEPYFSTKFSSQGTGIGLYMSKNIIENSMSGVLSAKNSENGAVFQIELPIGQSPKEIRD